MHQEDGSISNSSVAGALPLLVKSDVRSRENALIQHIHRLRGRERDTALRLLDAQFGASA
jgi:hypothetical protein